MPLPRRRFQAGGLNQLSNQEDRLNAGVDADSGLIDLPRANFQVESLDDPYSGFNSDFSDILPLDHPLNGGTPKLPAPITGSGEVGRRASQDLLKMYTELTPSAEELTGADAALQGAIQKLVKLNEYRAPEMNLPLLSLAAGLLSPTKTGSTFESFGNAIPGALNMFREERRYEDQRHQAQSEAEIALQRANKDAMLARQKLGVTALGNAARVEAAAQRGGKRQTKVVQGVGLVEVLDGPTAEFPDGYRVLVASPDPWNDPRINMAAERLVNKEADNYDFATADEKEAWKRTRLGEVLGKHSQRPATGAVPGQPPVTPKLPAVTSPPGAQPSPQPAFTQPVQVDAEPEPGAIPPLEDVPVPAMPARPASTQVGQPVLLDDATKAGNKEEAKKSAELAVQQFEDANNLHNAFRGMADQGKVVRAIDAETNRLAPMKAYAGAYLNALGLADEKTSAAVNTATNLQEMNAALRQVVLSRQLEQKGTQTEGDAKRMEETFTQLTNTKAANDFIIRATDAQAERARQQVQFMENWKAKNKSYVGSKSAWGNYLAQTPIVARVKQGETTVPVFMNEWMARARQVNPGASTQDLIARWRQVAK